MGNSKQQRNRYNLLAQYIALAFQWLFSLAIALYAGMWADKWLHLSFPLLVWVLPLLVIIAFIIKIIKDTSH